MVRALRLSALALALMSVVASCSSGHGATTPSSPASPASSDLGRAAIMQLRPVRDVAPPHAANYPDLHVSCGTGSPSPCTQEELVNASSLVLQGADGTRYALDAAVVNGDDVASATADRGAVQWVVDFQLGPDGTAVFAAITAPLADLPASDPTKRIAVVVDGEVASAPAVQVAITSGPARSAAGTIALAPRPWPRSCPGPEPRADILDPCPTIPS